MNENVPAATTNFPPSEAVEGPDSSQYPPASRLNWKARVRKMMTKQMLVRREARRNMTESSAMTRWDSSVCWAPWRERDRLDPQNRKKAYEA